MMNHMIGMNRSRPGAAPLATDPRLRHRRQLHANLSRLAMALLLLVLTILPLHTVRASVLGTPAAQASTPQVIFYGDPPYEVADNGDVSLYMSVRDASGLPQNLTELKDKKAISVLESGTDITSFDVTPEVLTRSVVVVLDTSGSMLEQDGTGITRLDRARKAAANFVLGLGAPVAVAVVVFNDTPGRFDTAATANGFNANTEEVARALWDDSKPANQQIPMPTGGLGTCINDAAEFAVNLSAAFVDARAKTVVLLTDGKEEKRASGEPNAPILPGCSKAAVEDVVIEAQQSKTQIFTLGYGAGNLEPSALRRMADATGGVYQQAGLTADLTPVYDQISQRLRGHYKLRYKSLVNNVSVPVRVKVDLGNGIQPDQELTVQIKALYPEIEALAPSEIVSGTEQTDPNIPVIRGRVTLTPNFRDKNVADRASKVEYYINDDPRPAFIASNIPYTWDWNTESALNGQNRAEVKVKAIAYNKADQQARPFESTFTVVPPPFSWDIPQLVLLGIGAVAVLTLLLTLFLFLNRGKGGAVAARAKPASVTKGEPLAQLTVVEGPGLSKPQEHFLYGDRSVGLGRDEDMAIQLPGERVSRQHGEILYRRNQFLYVESKATNGTLIDGQRVQKDTPVPLRDGVEILFGGQARAIFRLRQAGAAASAVSGYMPLPPNAQTGRAQQPVAASELHTTEWVREAPMGGAPQAREPQYTGPYAPQSGQYGGQAGQAGQAGQYGGQPQAQPQPPAQGQYGPNSPYGGQGGQGGQ